MEYSLSNKHAEMFILREEVTSEWCRHLGRWINKENSLKTSLRSPITHNSVWRNRRHLSVCLEISVKKRLPRYPEIYKLILLCIIFILPPCSLCEGLPQLLDCSRHLRSEFMSVSNNRLKLFILILTFYSCCRVLYYLVFCPKAGLHMVKALQAVLSRVSLFVSP